MFKDFKDFLVELLLLLIFLAIILVIPIIMFAEWHSDKSCTKYSEITGKNVNYSFFGGCFVETDSGWLTKSEYGQTIIAKEGLMSKGK